MGKCIEKFIVFLLVSLCAKGVAFALNIEINLVSYLLGSFAGIAATIIISKQGTDDE